MANEGAVERAKSLLCAGSAAELNNHLMYVPGFLDEIVGRTYLAGRRGLFPAACGPRLPLARIVWHLLPWACLARTCPGRSALGVQCCSGSPPRPTDRHNGSSCRVRLGDATFSCRAGNVRSKPMPSTSFDGIPNRPASFPAMSEPNTAQMLPWSLVAGIVSALVQQAVDNDWTSCC